MAKGKFLGFVGKVGSLLGNVIPGAGVAGKLAINAGKLMADKSAQEALKKERDKQATKEAKVLGGLLGGSTLGTSKLSVFLGDAWVWIKNNWYIVLPAVIAIIWVLFFKKKTRSTTRRRKATGRSYVPVRRKRSATPKGSAWARKMLLARRRKANARKRK